MNFGSIGDIWQAWNTLASTLSRGTVGATIEHSVITPNIIVVGDIPDGKIDELKQIVQGKPAVIWNLGAAFTNQVVDVQWKTPCVYTRAPTLDTVFSILKSIKSWYDLNDSHLAIIHCPPGQPGSGIVVACLLKYIGAFEHATHAYDFYCNKRLSTEASHSLAPSYRNLFINVDKTVDHDGFKNIESKFLRTITVAGLPVDDIPCIEVWDINGIIFSSHNGSKPSPSCTWNEEYSDGFYRVEKFVLGDFSITCRFGGQLAINKDKSTLIFKYQNSTAFLIEEVMELKNADVDINPQYADSLDAEIFKLHLMFDNSTRNENPGPNQTIVLPEYATLGPNSFKSGLDEITKMHIVVPDPSKSAELTSPVDGEVQVNECFVPVALQLSNNSLAGAREIINLVERRLSELNSDIMESDDEENGEEDGEATGVETVDDSRTVSPLTTTLDCASEDNNNLSNDICRKCKVDNHMLVDQLVLCRGCSQYYHTSCVGLRKIPFGQKTDKDRHSREKYIQHHFGSWKCERCSETMGKMSGDSQRATPTGELNTMTKSDSLPDQTVIGGAVIITDQVHHQAIPAANLLTPAAKRSRIPGSTSKSMLQTPMRHMASPNVRSKQDQVAMLVAALANAPVTIEELMKMSETKQRETLLKIVGEKFPEWSEESLKEAHGSLDLASALKSILNPVSTVIVKPVSLRVDPLTPAPARYFGGSIGSDLVVTATSVEDRSIGEGGRGVGLGKGGAGGVDNGTSIGGSGSGGGDGGALGTVGDSSATSSARAQMLEFMKNRARGGGGGGGGGRGQGGGSGGPGGGVGGGVGGGSVGDGSNGIGMGIAGAEGGSGTGSGGGGGGMPDIVRSFAGAGGFPGGGGVPGGGGSFVGGSAAAFASGIGGLFPGGGGGMPFGGGMGGGGGGGSSWESGNVGMSGKDIPEYQKYFKMIKAGLPKNAVVEKIVTDGVVESKEVANTLLGLKEDEPIPNLLANKLRVLVTMATHPKYTKFFNMLKMGIAKDIVKEKMSNEDVDPDVLEKDPNEKVPLYEGPLIMEKKSEDEEKKEPDGDKMIPINEHPKYAKYFKMLKMGLPKDAVKHKMTQDNVDATKIDLDPTTLIPEIEKPPNAKEEVKMVKVSEHPKYEKFFKMIKTGVPRQAVLNKMKAEGVDESMLDKDPNDMIPLDDKKKEEDEEEEDEGPKVPAAEHPKYAKYFKMLKMGLPKDAVKHKMVQDKVNDAILDKDPTELIPLDEEKAGKKKKKKKDVKMVPANEHPKYLKYFKMSKTGIPLEAIKLKMKQEGVDPTVLDKEPTTLIPLEDDSPDEEEDTGPKVKASEHPKYSKYFKMIQVGLPIDAVKMKMKSEGMDPTILDKNPDDMIPVDDKKKDPAGAKGKAGPAAAAKPKIRKKKLHLKALDASKVSENCLWADDNDMDIMLDEEEFNKLFVESAAESKKEQPKVQKEPKKQKVVLIDMKRAQNGSIALARIKFKFDDLKTKVLNMDEHGLTTDQLKSMIEYLPKGDEIEPLRNYKGDDDLIGIAEKYMRTMLTCDSAQQRMTCMIYKQQFRGRYTECYEKIKKIEQACDDVKMSVKLKKVLKTILKVGNQLNDGEDHKGFSVESLLKLQSAKAFDKKTTVLTYVVRLVARNDEESLRFPEELKNISEASRITMDMITTEKTNLKNEFDANFKMVEDIRAKDTESNTDSMIDFFVRADELCRKLENGFEKVNDKFIKVLEYFGEDPGMLSHDFFATLSKFVQEFVAVREIVERERKAELKRQAQAAATSEGATLNRRNSTTITAAPSKADEGSSSSREEGDVSGSKPNALQEMMAKRGMVRRGSVN